jgi:hypothetical protein
MDSSRGKRFTPVRPELPNQLRSDCGTKRRVFSANAARFSLEAPLGDLGGWMTGAFRGLLAQQAEL